MDCSGSDDGMGVVIDLRVLSYHRNLVVVAIIVFGDNMLCTLCVVMLVCGRVQVYCGI